MKAFWLWKWTQRYSGSIVYSSSDLSTEKNGVYRAGLGSVQAQLQVKNFSSRKYKPRRHSPENIATLFD